MLFFRLKRYKNFKEGQSRILVATDLVGRGIDIERVNIVINYDMPDSADTYLHRVLLSSEDFYMIHISLSFVHNRSCSFVDWGWCTPQVGRAGRFGTKGLAITFVSSAGDSDVLNQVIE